MSWTTRRDDLEQILDSPEFSRSEDKGWFQRLLESLGLIDESGAIRDGVTDAIEWALVALGAIAVIVVLMIIRRRLSSIGKRSSRESSSETDLSKRLNAHDALARARQSDNPREALHWYHLAMLLTLDESGAHQYDESLTNREITQALSDETAERVLPLVDSFDRVWYGQAVCDRSTVDDYVSGLGELERSLR